MCSDKCFYEKLFYGSAGQNVAMRFNVLRARFRTHRGRSRSEKALILIETFSTGHFEVGYHRPTSTVGPPAKGEGEEDEAEEVVGKEMPMR